ncbi:GntR family transcriptional regulator [Streptomyces sp. 8N706]|uniref:GntR family transcriptional regulator n=1 Tax=Streptomyces sp. 8N706 TaxID=3457416 RepID=UPI003FCF6270
MPAANPRGTYVLVADALRNKIKDGSVSGALPSEAQMMRDHGVSRTTIRRALAVLQAEGLIESAPGVGWSVSRGGDRRPLVERMTSLIPDRQLAVGDAFPSESELCQTFEVSRTAVRRALAQMEGNGLLDTVHGKGRTVRALPGPAVPS